jgi:hypothetical protein
VNFVGLNLFQRSQVFSTSQGAENSESVEGQLVDTRQLMMKEENGSRPRLEIGGAGTL